MKRVVLLILAVVLCFSLCACGKVNANTKKTPEEAVISAVKAQISAKIILSYNTVGVPNITTYVDEIEDNLYEVTGKVTVKDKYGDSYTGKYDAEVTYNPETQNCSVDLDLDSLYKD